ncbi:PQQ-binding-like beta-propeller repeat protein [Bacteroidota bacterium]
MKNNKSIRLLAVLLLIFNYSCSRKQNLAKEGNKNSSEQGQKVYKLQRESSSGQEQKVYEWRGENRSGIYCETELLKVWPKDGPELVWEYEGIGNGYGSPIFTTDKMYILGEIDDLTYLFAFDLEGNLLWKKDFGKEWVKEYGGSNSTPTIVNDFIYMTSGLGNVNCLNRNSGEKIWSVDMINDLHGTFPLFRYSESLIIEDEKVFCIPGGKDTNVVALNRFTGDLIWLSKGKGERNAYNSPQIIKLYDRNVLVNFTAYELMGHDTKTGELLWVHNQNYVKPAKRVPGDDEAHGNTIIYEDGFIYYATTGAGNGGVKLELAKDGKSIKEIWRNKDFDGYMGGIVKVGDYLYGCGTAKRGLKSINAETGEIEKVLKVGNGAVIGADDMLYYYNFRGEVILITQDPKNMKVVSKFRIKKGDKEHFAHPVINNGKLYVRHGNVIQAFNIKES